MPKDRPTNKKNKVSKKTKMNATAYRTAKTRQMTKKLTKGMKSKKY